MEFDYIEENKLFDIFLKSNNYSKKDLTKQDLSAFCDLSKIKVKQYKKIDINYNCINNLFLSSINELGDNTVGYYKDILKKIKIKRRSLCEPGFAEIVGNSKEQEINVTSKKFKDIDFIAFSHELGHVYSFRNGARLDYYEYSETLPIFFEYLASLNIYKEDGLDHFLRTRLKISKGEYTSFKELDSIKCFDDKNHFLYIENNKRDCLKYLISLEYALNLIDIYNTSKDEIKNIIENVIFGYSSFKDLEDNLNIDTDKCKKLIKSTESYIK